MTSRRLAFSLIEILVVIAIILLFMSLIGLSTRKEQRGAQVRGEAEQLAGVLRRTRHRAIADRTTYAVVFHVQNEPGSSGAVLNNRSGGHWYRVLGPGSATRHSNAVPETVPWARSQRLDTDGSWRNTNFPDFVADVARSWIGEPHVLPARRVRFLALGDTDEGPRFRRNTTATSGEHIYYGHGGETTYPRPWFGYFDPATRTLWPWGGYTPGKVGSGFVYEGDDGAVVGSVHPNDRTVNHDWNGNNQWQDVDRDGDGVIDPLFEREVGWAIQRAGEPRPLVDSAWLDACIVFKPDGTVLFGEWNRARRAYDKAPDPSPALHDNNFRSGVSDRAKRAPDGRWLPLTNRQEGECPFEIGEVAHFVQHTGGWHITLAPDSLDDRTEFADAAQALASMTPMWRVHISANGAVRTFPVGVRQGYLRSLQAQNKAWPQDPSDWLDTGLTNGNRVWRRCRIGYLHATSTSNALPAPAGTPITAVVDPDMLGERVWWIEP